LLFAELVLIIFLIQSPTIELPPYYPLPQYAMSEIDVNSELLRIVSLESDGSYEGSLAVANVILNRVKDGRWGDSIHEVVSAKSQFSTYGSDKSRKITDEVYRGCRDATLGLTNIPDYVMWFCTPRVFRANGIRKVYARFAGTVWYYYD
jgi:hypothetical protein